MHRLVWPLLMASIYSTLSVSGSLIGELEALGLRQPGQRRVQREPNQSTRQACASKTLLSALSGQIVSPGMSGPGYPIHTTCTWIIKTAPTHRLKLYVELVDLDCEGTAILDVSDTGASTELMSTKICSDKTPNSIPIFSYTNEMTVRFTAPEKGKSKFRLRYTAILPLECGAPFVRPLYSLEDISTAPTTTTTAGPLPDNPMLGIVGGEEAAAHSWPWMITLTYFDLHMCGAVLLNDHWAITAAHCVDSLWTAEELTVEVGRHTSSWMEFEKPKLVQLVSIKQFIVHENFDGITYDNDIALIELNETVSFNEHVQPLCISHNPPIPGKLCVIAGWGVTQGTADESVLNQAVVPIIEQSVCKQDDWYGNRILDLQFCAGYEKGIIDTCTGDSGGPLMCSTNAGTWELVGLTSWGDDCGQPKKPGVYTRVLKFLDWIKQNSNGGIQT